MNRPNETMRVWSRRELLVAGGSVLLLAACGSNVASVGGSMVGQTASVVESREALRRKIGGTTVTATVTAAPVTVGIGGREVTTWAFGDRPGMGG
ncbi:MAG: hypothetical protein AAB327_01995, partial [Actinomycetota bacterium]